MRRQRMNYPRIPLDKVSPESRGHMTAANAMEYTNGKQMLIHSQDIGQRLQRTPLTRLPPGHNSVHSQTTVYHKRYITHQMLADGQNTNTTCKRDKLLVVNYVKFHLTILAWNQFVRGAVVYYPLFWIIG